MNKGNDIYEELKDMGSPLATLPRTMPYQVPAGYFDTLPGASAAQLNTVAATEYMPEMGKEMPYGVPDNYFVQLTGDIVAAATKESMRKETPYGVPAGYFEQLPEQVLAAAMKEESVVPKKRLVIPLPWRRAVAAVVVMGIGFAGYSVIFKQQATTTDTILATVPNNEIQDYLQVAYRLDAGSLASNNDVANIQVENKDIIQYLNENGWDVVD